MIQSNDMTIGLCINHCLDLDVPFSFTRYAGVAAGNECWCGDVNAQYGQLGQRQDGDCYRPCAGDTTQTCGADFHVQVYDLELLRCKLPQFQYGIVTAGSGDFVEVGMSVSFSCDPGYELFGQRYLQCIVGISNVTQWDTSLPECHEGEASVAPSNAVGIVAGASVGAVLFLVLIVLLLYLYKIRKSDPSEIREDTDPEAYEIPATLSDQTSESVYQEMTNRDPDRLKTADNYQSLDDPEAYEIPPTLSDQTSDNQNVSNPGDVADNETYTGLDTSTRQPESVYQETTNQGPDCLKTADNYQSLDATSRLSTADYQGIYHDVKMEVHSDEDVIYHEYMDPMAGPGRSQSTVPVPPTVNVVDNLHDGPYVNVKEATNNRKT